LAGFAYTARRLHDGNVADLLVMEAAGTLAFLQPKPSGRCVVT
jgi:hypothetical protein